MKGSDFVFSSVDLLYCHLHKISLKRGESYIGSPKWLKNKLVTINPQNEGNECFKYTITVALNHKQIKNYPERISNLKPFIDQYEWKNINFPATIKDWEKFEQDNKTIGLNILFVPYNTKKIKIAYKSKYSHKRNNQVNLLMITDREKEHYLAVKGISALFRGITSSHVGDFYCSNCFHSYRATEKLKKHEKVCNNHDYCYLKMPKEDKKILKYNHGEKSLKVPFAIYADLECLLEKINLEKSSTEKKTLM